MVFWSGTVVPFFNDRIGCSQSHYVEYVTERVREGELGGGEVSRSGMHKIFHLKTGRAPSARGLRARWSTVTNCAIIRLASCRRFISHTPTHAHTCMELAKNASAVGHGQIVSIISHCAYSGWNDYSEATRKRQPMGK